MIGVRIGWCTDHDAPIVHALTQAAFAAQAGLDPPSGALRESVERVADDLRDGRGVLARLDARPVAAARVLFPAGHLHVRRVAVEPSLQGRGIATTLMGWLHEEAAALGYSEVRLGVRTALKSNLALYESLGYRPCADHGFWVELRRRLTAAG